MSRVEGKGSVHYQRGMLARRTLTILLRREAAVTIGFAGAFILVRP